jgi:predicted dehydrogenase
MIRVGLIGFGLGGRVFHAPLISSVEGMELTGVLERATGNASKRYPATRIFRTFDEMLADELIRLIVVTTPNATHFEIARKALEAGRNTIVDKPMAMRSAEIAELMRIAAGKNLLLAPFHNRRWDSDFLTVQKVLGEQKLGRLVSFESHFNRWRPSPVANKPWKEDSTNGGLLADLGTHLIDQALVLFGRPRGVSAEVLRERDGHGANDSFTIRLRYEGLTATLGANCLSLAAGPRFFLRGTHGNYSKHGLDPQEAALGRITRIEDPEWGWEAQPAWGSLYTDAGGATITQTVEPVPGDYRRFYEGIRDALAGKGPAPVAAVEAWRTARIAEWAVESAAQRREITCEWSGEPG